ncbi:MAG: RNA-binding S4 domain-containing protein [Negativicutes bacterium]
MKTEMVDISTDFIQLDQLLKWIGVTETGGQARFLIDEGNVKVNGVVLNIRRKKIFPGDRVKIGNQEYLVVRENEQNHAD